jgi:leucyl-tRNA synthetase
MTARNRRLRRGMPRIGTTEEAIETAPKLGFDTGLKVRHPLDPAWELPIWIANFVLMDYGTGAIFGSPAHDERDHEFATEIRPADSRHLSANAAWIWRRPTRLSPSPLCADEIRNRDLCARLCRRRRPDRRGSRVAAIAHAEQQGYGEGVTKFRLRDWGISRQRYWGCPIPVVHCEACGTVPEAKENLPVLLPQDVSFDVPGNPLDRHPTWRNHLPGLRRPGAARNRHHGHLRRFVLVLRALHRAPCATPDRARGCRLLDECRPVYRRHRARDSAPAVFALLRPRDGQDRPPARTAIEPFNALFTQGMVTHEIYMTRDEKGRPVYHLPEDVVDGKLADGTPVEVIPSAKMSKSKKNVVDPVNIVANFGADTARWFMLSDSPPERDVEWTAAGAEAANKFLPASGVWPTNRPKAATTPT